jgi:AraC-like DNA-binding protein
MTRFGASPASVTPTLSPETGIRESDVGQTNDPDNGAGGRELVWMRVEQLRDPEFSLRIGPIRDSHVELLIQLNGCWPPLLVNRHDNSVIDGHYRLVAAQRLGFEEVAAYLFDGSTDAAYLEAIRRNTTHGLLLSLRERENAATHLLRSHPDWSDRRIAETCTLSPGTIKRLRHDLPRPIVQNGHLDKRQGRDDRRRPVDQAGTRGRIRDALCADPGASLRTIARLVGCSPETVRAVRNQLDVDIGQPTACPEPWARDRDVQRVRHIDQADRALVSTDEGASFIRWFAETSVDEEDCRRHLSGVPLSRIYEVADEARQRGAIWLSFARDLETRSSAERAR